MAPLCFQEEIFVTQYLRHNLGYKKYKLFDVTKFILVLPTFFVKTRNLQLTSIEKRPSVGFMRTSKVLYLKHIKLV